MVFAFLCLTYFMKHNALKALSMFLDKCYFFLITKRFAIVGFPGSSAGKEFACNSGDRGSISGSGSFPGERIGYPLQYSWTSLVAQMVKNAPAMWKTWV